MMFRYALLLLLAGCVSVGTSQLIISEIMIGPNDATDKTTTWVELYNMGSTTIELDGWRLWPCINSPGCVNTNNKAFVTPAAIGPFGYAIVGNNDNVMTNGGIFVDVLFPTLGPWPADGTGQQKLGLYNPFNFPKDIVYWSTDQADAKYLPFPFVVGASLARICSITDAQDVTNWKASTAPIIPAKGTGDKGTPRKANGPFCPVKAPTKAPTKTPTKSPTKTPTKSPTKTPAKDPTKAPSRAPTKAPVKVPSSTTAATTAPTKAPTKAPVKVPTTTTTAPNKAPTTAPNKAPTTVPSKTPTAAPSKAPIEAPAMAVPAGGAPTRKKCGLFKLGIICLNGCGLIGTILGLCDN